MTMSTTKKVPLEIIDLVRQKKVLLAACALTVNECGNTTFNYTVPIFVQTYSFLTAKPSQLSRVLLFASPFTKEVRNSFFHFLRNKNTKFPEFPRNLEIIMNELTGQISW